MNELLEKQQSLLISSLSPNGVPEVSYAPFVMKDKSVYVYLSKLANHNPNLTENPQCSVMAILDESETKNIFARERISFECVAKKSETINQEIEELYIDRHGRKNYEHIKTAHDFDWFELEIQKGRLVQGFGKAFDVTIEDGEFQQTHIRLK